MSITDSAVPFVIVITPVPSIDEVGALHRPFGNCRKFPVARALLSVQLPYVTPDGLTVTDKIPGPRLAVTVAVLELLAIAGVTTAAATTSEVASPSDATKRLGRAGLVAISARGDLRLTRGRNTVAPATRSYGTAVHVTVVVKVGDWSVLADGPSSATISFSDWPAVAEQSFANCGPNAVSQNGVFSRLKSSGGRPTWPTASWY
jgi:hypothetical protein